MKTLLKSISLFTVIQLSVNAGWVSAADGGESRYFWNVGVAVTNITPEGPIWMGGYTRTRPTEGVLDDIFAKALALDDGKGGRAVLITADLIGIPKSMRDFVVRECARRFGLKESELLLNASHTHSGPEIRLDRFETQHTEHATPQHQEAARQYRAWLDNQLVSLVGAALADAAPAVLEFSKGRAGFAMNRRLQEEGGAFSNNPNPDGPVDHEVPVLKATDRDGSVKAVLFGYACHNTTLRSILRISGDYAGYAQKFLEASYPGTVALFMAGCGGDQNPYPRRNMIPDQPAEVLVQQHGRALANAVSTALSTRMRSVNGPLRGAYGYAQLNYWPLSADELRTRLKEPAPPAVRARAESLLRAVEAGESVPGFSCPIQVLRFGEDLTLVAIGGEPVVDYSLRIRSELKGSAQIWVAGYSNASYGYLGSRRVLVEGGYEGGRANVRLLNHPGPFTYDAEAEVVATVLRLWREAAP